MTESSNVEVLAALVCDDVRKEDNGKEIIIGVYTGDILVPGFPANLVLCLWILVKFKRAGELKLKFRVMGADDNQLLHFDGRAQIEHTDTPASLPLPRFPLALGKEMLLRFEWQIDDGEWTNLVAKPIRLRHPNPIPSSV